jgi:transglycosylase-like protein with SLT domain
MRFYVASAAMMVAALMPFASHSNEGVCAKCAAVHISVVARSTFNRGLPMATPTRDAPANQPQSDATSDERTKRDICATLIGAARDNDLPPAFLARLIWQESEFDSQSVSHAGAIGIAQFMPQTASEIGLSDPYDPSEALPASARLLAKLHREFGNLGLAAAAYNAGSGRIRDWLSKRQSLPRETKNYVRIITGYSAEDWTEEQSVLALPTSLAEENPCREINEADGGAAVPVKVVLSGEITSLMQRAKAEIEAAPARARRLVKLHRGRRAKETTIALHSRRKALAARSSRKARLADA